MTQYFDENALRQLAEGFAAVPKKAQELVESFLVRQYISDVAKEYAHHGVARRIKTLARCIDQIYRNLPPEFDELPSRDVRTDATIFIQAFVFNTFGVLDNLAFVWVNEKNVRARNGRALPNGRIGLTNDKDQVRESFSASMQAYFEKCDPWFTHLENFRHSLGHHIPLYIPPYIVAPENLAQYEALEAGMNSLRRGDSAEHSRLKPSRSPW